MPKELFIIFRGSIGIMFSAVESVPILTRTGAGTEVNAANKWIIWSGIKPVA